MFSKASDGCMDNGVKMQSRISGQLKITILLQRGMITVKKPHGGSGRDKRLFYTYICIHTWQKITNFTYPLVFRSMKVKNVLITCSVPHRWKADCKAHVLGRILFCACCLMQSESGFCFCTAMHCPLSSHDQACVRHSTPVGAFLWGVPLIDTSVLEALQASFRVLSCFGKMALAERRIIKASSLCARKRWNDNWVPSLCAAVNSWVEVSGHVLGKDMKEHQTRFALIKWWVKIQSRWLREYAFM